jgi:hypothetical protein
MPYDPRHRYIAHADPSGGGADSFTLCIGHKEGDTAVVDLLLEDRGSKPLEAVARCAEALRQYGLYEVSGDKYAAGFVVDGFAQNNIRYDKAEMTTSEFFAGLLPILNSGKVTLLDNKRLASQLCALERRTNRAGGKDTIGHPVGGHDDLAAAVAGLSVRLVGVVSPDALRVIEFPIYGGVIFDGSGKQAPPWPFAAE